MISNEQLRKKMKATHDLYVEFIEQLTIDELSYSLPHLPSNSIGQQLWCVIGARESFCKAIKASGWQGFDCSLSYDDCHNNGKVAAALKDTWSIISDLLTDTTTINDIQADFLLSLYGHETQHQGQLIRYLYANRLSIPPGWKKAYSL